MNYIGKKTTNKTQVNPNAHEKVIARAKSKFYDRKPESPYVNQLHEAMLRVEKQTGARIFDHLIERAFKSDTVLINVVKKLVPDLKQVEGTVSLDGHVSLSYMTDEDIANALSAIRDSYRDSESK